jgi:hypothetical protein
MPSGRIKGSKNRKTRARERVEKIAAARNELAKNAPGVQGGLSPAGAVPSGLSCARAGR